MKGVPVIRAWGQTVFWSNLLTISSQYTKTFTLNNIESTILHMLFAEAATLKSIDYNVATTFILNNNNYYYYMNTVHQTVPPAGYYL